MANNLTDFELAALAGLLASMFSEPGLGKDEQHAVVTVMETTKRLLKDGDR